MASRRVTACRSRAEVRRPRTRRAFRVSSATSESGAPPCVCAAACRDYLRLARRGDMGRLDPAPRGVRPARLEAPGRRAARPRRPAADGNRRPVPLTEVRNVLADRLRSLEVDPPANRYGRVFVGSPHQARGRSFSVVFVPRTGRALVPPEAARRSRCCSTICAAKLPRAFVQPDRADLERLLLRLAIGAAADGSTCPSRASKPPKHGRASRLSTRLRSCVPSPAVCPIIRRSSGGGQESAASLAWPAPADAADAIDDSNTTCRCSARSC